MQLHLVKHYSRKKDAQDPDITGLKINAAQKL